MAAKSNRKRSNVAPLALGRPRGEVSTDARLDEVVAASTELFAERGFRGTPLDVIAGRLGVTRAALYYYFDSKEDILELICSKAMEAAEGVLASLPEGGDPVTALRDFAQSYAAVQISDQARVSRREMSELRSQFRLALLARERRLTDGVTALIQRGIEAGSIRPDLNARLVAFALLGTINSLSMWYRPTGLTPLDEIVESTMEIWLHGMVPH